MPTDLFAGWSPGEYAVFWLASSTLTALVGFLAGAFLAPGVRRTGREPGGKPVGTGPPPQTDETFDPWPESRS